MKDAYILHGTVVLTSEHDICPLQQARGENEPHINPPGTDAATTPHGY